ALGRAEAGERAATMRVDDRFQPASGAFQRLLPGRLAEHGERIDTAHVGITGLRRIVTADQRLGQPLRRHGVVEAEAALDAQSVLIGWAVAAVDLDNSVVLDGNRGLTADAAERTQRVHDLVELLDGTGPGRFIHERLFIERPGRASLHALAAGHAGRQTHRVVHVEDGNRMTAAIGHADDVVDLDLAAGAHAGA